MSAARIAGAASAPWRGGICREYGGEVPPMLRLNTRGFDVSRARLTQILVGGGGASRGEAIGSPLVTRSKAKYLLAGSRKATLAGAFSAVWCRPSGTAAMSLRGGAPPVLA